MDNTDGDSILDALGMTDNTSMSYTNLLTGGSTTVSFSGIPDMRSRSDSIASARFRSDSIAALSEASLSSLADMDSEQVTATAAMYASVLQSTGLMDDITAAAAIIDMPPSPRSDGRSDSASVSDADGIAGAALSATEDAFGSLADFSAATHSPFVNSVAAGVDAQETPLMHNKSRTMQRSGIAPPSISTLAVPRPTLASPRHNAVESHTMPVVQLDFDLTSMVASAVAEASASNLSSRVAVVSDDSPSSNVNPAASSGPSFSLSLNESERKKVLPIPVTKDDPITATTTTAAAAAAASSTISDVGILAALEVQDALEWEQQQQQNAQAARSSNHTTAHPTPIKEKPVSSNLDSATMLLIEKAVSNVNNTMDNHDFDPDTLDILQKPVMDVNTMEHIPTTTTATAVPPQPSQIQRPSIPIDNVHQYLYPPTTTQHYNTLSEYAPSSNSSTHPMGQPQPQQQQSRAIPATVTPILASSSSIPPPPTNYTNIPPPWLNNITTNAHHHVKQTNKRKNRVASTDAKKNYSLTPKKSTAGKGGQSNQKWDEMLNCLIEYVKEKQMEGAANLDKPSSSSKIEKIITNDGEESFWDGNVPTNYKTVDGKALGRWVNNQRSAKHKGTLKRDRELRLVSTGLKWSVLSTNTWSDMMSELKTYIEDKTKNGKEWDGNVPTNYKIKSNTNNDGSEIDEEKNLGRWVNRQRCLFQSGRLRKDRQIELEEIGLKWSVLSTSTWQSMYDALCQYSKMKRDLNDLKNNGKTWDGNVPANYKTDDNPPKSLGRWVNRQRSAYTKGKLKKELVDKLEKVGLKWAVHERKGKIEQGIAGGNVSSDDEDAAPVPLVSDDTDTTTNANFRAAKKPKVMKLENEAVAPVLVPATSLTTNVPKAVAPIPTITPLHATSLTGNEPGAVAPVPTIMPLSATAPSPATLTVNAPVATVPLPGTTPLPVTSFTTHVPDAAAPLPVPRAAAPLPATIPQFTTAPLPATSLTTNVKEAAPLAAASLTAASAREAVAQEPGTSSTARVTDAAAPLAAASLTSTTPEAAAPVPATTEVSATAPLPATSLTVNNSDAVTPVPTMIPSTATSLTSIVPEAPASLLATTQVSSTVPLLVTSPAVDVPEVAVQVPTITPSPATSLTVNEPEAAAPLLPTTQLSATMPLPAPSPSVNAPHVVAPIIPSTATSLNVAAPEAPAPVLATTQVSAKVPLPAPSPTVNEPDSLGTKSQSAERAAIKSILAEDVVSSDSK